MEAAKVYHPRMRAYALFALFAGATCIALSPIWVRVADVGPTASAFWRVALAAPLLWVVAALAPRVAAAPERGRGTLLLLAGLAFAGDLHRGAEFDSSRERARSAMMAASQNKKNTQLLIWMRLICSQRNPSVERPSSVPMRL